MKNIISSVLYIVAAVAISGCAKAIETSSNDLNRQFLEAWISVHHKDIKPSGLGIYVLEETQGSGTTVQKDGFAIVDYTITDLEGNISSYTSKETAKQLGQYDTSYYYGSKVWTTTEGTIQAGLADALIGMQTGGRKKVVIPGWLLTYKVYDNVEDYLNPPKKGSSGTTTYDNAIYEFTVNDYVDNINDWQITEIGEYFNANPEYGMTAKDSVQTGFYYKQLIAPKDTTSFGSDTTIYINYTGKLLNGLVFDTTDERTAKDNGIYSASKEYKPVPVRWAKEYSEIKLDGSGIITGFALTLWQMRAYEKGVGIFYSDLGYKHSGSGKQIPGYTPLIFEIQIVDKPKEE